MVKKLLNNRQEFERWIKKQEECLHNSSFDWNDCKSPEKYPCVVAWFVVDAGYFEEDYLCYEFIYINDFE